MNFLNKNIEHRLEVKFLHDGRTEIAVTPKHNIFLIRR